MKFTEEMVNKARNAASPEELMQLAKAEGIALTAEEAGKYYSFYSGESELSDEALEAVAGGKHASNRFKAGQHVKFWYVDHYLTGWITKAKYSDLQGAWYYVTKLDGGQGHDGSEWDLPLELSMYHTVVI